MGKALQTVLAEMTVKDAASASLTNIYRKQQQVNKALQQGEQQAKRTEKSLEKMSKGMKAIGDNVKKMSGSTMGGVSAAMTGGGSALVARIPGIGGLFSSASSAVESAAQQFVAGISAGKNIKLLSSNFAAAMGIGLDRSIYRARDRMSAYSKLGDIGVDKELVGKNQGQLEQFARSQGLGSMEEAVQALASGQIKQGRGLSKSQIDLINSYKDLLGNAHTASIGFELIAGVLKEASAETKKYSDRLGAGEMYRNRRGQMVRGASAADLIQSEGNIQTSEENYMAGGASLFGGSYASMNRIRSQDREMQAQLLPAAQRVSRVQHRVVGAVSRLARNVQEHGLVEGYRISNQEAAQEIQDAGGTASFITGGEGEQPRRAEGGPVEAGRMYTVGEHGRETFVPNTSGRIMSAQESRRMGGSGKMTVINNITVPLEGFAQILERETMKAMNKAGRTLLPMHLGVQPRG